MACIRERGKYQWHAEVNRKGYPRVSKTFETKADAERWARGIEREMDAGEFRDRRPAAEMTLGAAMERYLREVSPQNKGHDVEKLRLNALLKQKLASYSFAALTPEIITQYRDKRLEKVRPATVRRELDLLSQVISHAILDWHIPIANPISLTRRPPPSKARDRRLESNEEATLRTTLTSGGRDENGAFTKGTRNPWINPLYELSIETAARRSELLGASWEDVHFEDRYIWKEDTKNGDSREIPLSAKAVEILKHLKTMHDQCVAAAREAGKTFADDRVFKTTENAVKKAWARAKAREGITDLRWHDLRHEGTTRAAAKLSNIIELSAYTGHKDPRQLKRYYNPRAKDIAAKLDG